MDESSLTTLSSLLTFTHADIVKGVTCAPNDSYLVKVLRLLGTEIRAIRELEWTCTNESRRNSIPTHNDNSRADVVTSNSSSNSHEPPEASWKQHLLPQDDSLPSRKIRRRGCLSFLRELFNMVRMSLQQADKDDFYHFLAEKDVELDVTNKDLKETILPKSPGETVTLLSLLGAILSDINSDVSEKGACLEILLVIAMFDASLIRKHCLNENRNVASITRPHPDHKGHVSQILILTLDF